ncbi:uncharacterized protein [Littorina saxatilis]|uniref:Caspase-8 n=1 Tax=Littorina saxatilis TaxID=31220 RepID=A0AAN9C2P0_9CAEN
MTSQDRMQTDAQAQDQPNFMSAVMKIDNELHDEDVESMKFLCQGLVVGSKLKRVDTAHELVSHLQSSNNVKQNDLFLLADLLQYIGRIDVLEEIGFEEKEVILRRQQQGSSINPFYLLLFQIAEELPMEDVKKAAFHYGKVPRSRTILSGLDLFTIMVQHQSVRPDNVGLLGTIFDSLERRDLVELVDRYIDTNGQSVMDDLVQNFVRAMSFRGHDYGNMFAAQPQASHGTRYQNGQGPSVHNIDVFYRPAGPSNYDSMSIQTPSQPRTDPSAPPPSLPTMGPGDARIPQGGQNSNGTRSLAPHIPVLSEAPEGYDRFVIPWNVLDALSRNIPDEFWPELSYRLGAAIQGDGPRQKMSRFHKLAMLKRWLELPETRQMDEVNTQSFLMKALAHAGPTLMAQRIAEELNFDLNAIMQDSMSTVSDVSVYETNAISSAATAAHVEFEDLQQGPTRTRAEARAQSAAMARVSPYSGPVPVYPMTRNPRGLCLIINNRDFYQDRNFREAKKMINREGTDVDRDKLHATFTRLNFDTRTIENCTDKQLVQIMGQVAFEDHSNYDCFACCILSHGVQGAVYGVNGMTVPIRDLTSPVRAQACPSLAGKPKLFFLQACQGREKQGAHDIQRDCEVEEDAPPAELIPNESDFLLGYATVPGFVSYRSKTRGSWYITKLTEMLQKHAEDHDILDILTLVNFEVGKGDALIEGGHFKQSPAPMYSLRKKLIFGRV